ncbi:MAG: ubiquinone anaerobic biosynthesis accessory factor UbiT [Pseudomonadota bacterium]
MAIIPLPSPFRLASRLWPSPLAALALPADLAVARVLRRHPDMARRLPREGDVSILIAPHDAPLAFLLCLRKDRIRLRPVAKASVADATATIRGPLAALLALVQGSSDGDALFFSRALSIEGDTELVVALRNAVDGADLDLWRDVLAVPAPLRPVLRRLALGGDALLRRLIRDIERWHAILAALTPPSLAGEGGKG